MNTLCSFWCRNRLFPERFPSLPFVRNVEIAVMTSAILPAVACPKRKKRLSGLVFRLFPLAEANAILPAAVLNKARKLRACRSSVCLVEIRIKMCKRKIYKVIKRKLFVALCSERNALRIDRLMRMFRFPSACLCRRAESVQAANTVYVTFVRCRSLHLFPQTLCSCRLGRENVQPNFDLLTINSVVLKKMFFCRPGFDKAVICNGLPFFSRQSIIAAGFRIFARRPFVTVYFFRPWQALIMPVFLYF